MLRIVPHTVPRVGRSYEHFPDGFELHLLRGVPTDQVAGFRRIGACREQRLESRFCKGVRVPYPYQPPYVPTVLPTIGSFLRARVPPASIVVNAVSDFKME